MVFVKVRETYDLHTIKNKMTIIAIHTPKPDIIKKNYPGLLMQCRAYRPVSCDVRVACASMQSLDPLQVGTASTDIAPEDVFNPILYKAMSNFGMSQLEARINYLAHNPVTGGSDINGDTATVDVDSTTNLSDEFNVYYNLLANTREWKHANPQAGLEMTGLRPLVYEILYNVGDNANYSPGGTPSYPTLTDAAVATSASLGSIRGNAKPMPFINTTAYTYTAPGSGEAIAGFTGGMYNCEQTVPWINCVVGVICVAPSKLHELFYRMVVEWTIEFSQIRQISEIANWTGLASNPQHYQNYSYSSTKEAVTGDPSTILESDSCMVSANVDVNKVM